MTESDNDATRDEIWRHVRDIETCMMVTRDGDGLRSRPMTPILRPGENTIWFFADADNHKDEEIDAAPRGCLAFAEPRSHCYVSLSGTFGVQRDRATIDALWNDAAAAYFPNGKDDPRVILLKFEPERGEFWDAPSGAIAKAYAFIKSTVTGQRPMPGDSGRARMQGGHAG